MGVMRTYLEYSEASGSGHKFYEASVEDQTLTLRYGRIGTEGQTQVKTFSTSEAAETEAEKKLAEKRKKGYIDAVPGEREKRALEHPVLRLPKPLTPYRAALEASVRPYVRLRGTPGKAYPWTSKLGGLPYRPAGFEWPCSRTTGRPLAFLAQLNLAELPHLDGFPAEGIVQFFIGDSDFYGANFHGALDITGLSDDANFRVLYHPAVTHDEAALDTGPSPCQPDPTTMGLPHDPAREFVLQGELTAGPVTLGDRLFEGLIGKPVWELEDEGDDMLERYERLAGTGHKLGGFPNFTQSDPRTLEDPHVLLFQLDSDDDLDLMWGDVGIGNFFIPPEDLARGDFHRVAYNWDCS